MGKHLVYLFERFKDSEFIIAVDSDKGYWRHDYYRKWYKDFGIKVFRIKDTRFTDKDIGVYYLEYDDNVYQIKYWPFFDHIQKMKNSMADGMTDGSDSHIILEKIVDIFSETDFASDESRMEMMMGW